MTITKKLQNLIKLLGGNDTSDNLISTKLDSIIALNGGTSTEDDLITSKLRYIAELMNGRTESSLYTEMIADIIVALGSESDSMLISEQLDVIIESLNIFSKYQRVEYIESSGTQYIDTGVVFLDKYGIEAEVQFLNINTSAVYECAFGVRSSDSGVWFGYGDTSAASMAYGSSIIDQGFSTPLKIHSIKIDGKGLYIDNVILRDNSKITYIPIEKTMPLFTRKFGDILNKSTMRMYKCTIFDQEGVLIRNYIPCIRKSDSVAGLYDAVNKVFYTNAGTGEFIVPT